MADIIPDDKSLLERAKNWTLLLSKFEINEPESNGNDSDYFIDNSEDCEGDDENNKISDPEFECAADPIESDDDVDMDERLTEALQVVKKREEDWHKNGLVDVFMRTSFPSLNKVECWLKKSNFLNTSNTFSTLNLSDSLPSFPPDDRNCKSVKFQKVSVSKFDQHKPTTRSTIKKMQFSVMKYSVQSGRSARYYDSTDTDDRNQMNATPRMFRNRKISRHKRLRCKDMNDSDDNIRNKRSNRYDRSDSDENMSRKQSTRKAICAAVEKHPPRKMARRCYRTDSDENVHQKRSNRKGADQMVTFRKKSTTNPQYSADESESDQSKFDDPESDSQTIEMPSVRSKTPEIISSTNEPVKSTTKIIIYSPDTLIPNNSETIRLNGEFVEISRDYIEEIIGRDRTNQLFSTWSRNIVTCLRDSVLEFEPADENIESTCSSDDDIDRIFLNRTGKLTEMKYL